MFAKISSSISLLFEHIPKTHGGRSYMKIKLNSFSIVMSYVDTVSTLKIRKNFG